MDAPGALSWHDNNRLAQLSKAQSLETEGFGVGSFVTADVDVDSASDLIASVVITAFSELPTQVHEVRWYANRVIGESNNDRHFSSGDLAAVFQAGKYENGIPDNSSFDEGDWNQDGDFASSDLVLSFQSGH